MGLMRFGRWLLEAIILANSWRLAVGGSDFPIKERGERERVLGFFSFQFKRGNLILVRDTVRVLSHTGHIGYGSSPIPLRDLTVLSVFGFFAHFGNGKCSFYGHCRIF